VRFDVLSLFPDYFKSPLDISILGRAIRNGLIDVRLWNIRDFSTERHAKVDDRPYGGGPGMVLMAEPLLSAVRYVKRDASSKTQAIYLSPQGQLLNAAHCRRLSSYERLILICGHYEGIDQRVIDQEVDEEISIGDYVLTSGCLPAIVLMDAVSRFIKGVVGREQSVEQDSFEETLFDAPQYTRPVSLEGSRVPGVLLSGHHQKIRDWKRNEGEIKARKMRPELFNEGDIP